MKEKTIYFNGEPLVIRLTDEDIDELEKEVDLCKLNGFSEHVFLDHLSVKFHSWKDTASRIFQERERPEVEKGMGCTINLYSDKRAATVICVVSPNEIKVRHNKTKCLDYYAGQYEILDDLDPAFKDETYTLRKSGTWVAKGQPKKYGSVTLTLGYRHHFIDPSF